MNQFEQCIDEWATRCRDKDAQITSLQTALDAEREKVQTLRDERDALKLVNETHMKTINKLSRIIEQSGDAERLRSRVRELEKQVERLEDAGLYYKEYF